jgi:two-component system, sensor histidine kinase PdtaS
MYKKQIIVLLLTAAFTLQSMAQQLLPDSLQRKIQTAPDTTSKIYALLDAGDFYYQQYNADGYSKAAGYYEKARLVANTTADSNLIGITYHSLGQVYDAVGDESLPKALEYYKIFNRTSFLSKDTPVILRSFINVSHTLMRLNRQQECIASLEKLTSLAKQYNKIKNLNRVYVVAAYITTRINRYDLSRTYFDKIDVKNDTITNGSLSYKNWYQLTKVYLLGAEKKYSEALAAGEEALQVCNNQSDSMAIFNYLVNFAASAGQYKTAFEYKQKEMQLYGNITRNNSLTAVNNTLLKSELKLKEENGTLLIKQQSIQKRINLWLTLGLVGMGLALAGTFLLATARRKQSKELIKQVNENKLLLQEVHHRVKNNLQIVNSFLLLEENKENGGNKTFIRELQTKIQAIALLHQKLHTNQQYGDVELQPYFEQLTSSIIASHTTNGEVINYTVNSNGLHLNQDKVISLALITTELLLNSIKYVAHKQPCTISITITANGNDVIYQYTDNGTGLPVALNFDKLTTTGLLLVKQLTKQLGGTVQYAKEENKSGFKIIIPSGKK